MQVSANGGEPEAIVKLVDAELAVNPQVLDGGKLLLFTLSTGLGPSRWDTAQVVVQSMTSGERHVVASGASAARYVASGLGSARAQRADGHLIYAVGNSLMAAPFDLERLEVRGAPVMVVEQVARGINATGIAHYAVSSTGMLVYVPGATDDNLPRRIAFATRDGKIQPLDLPAQQYVHPRLSPDGNQLAVGTDDAGGADVWVYDLKTRGSLRRLTFAGRNQFPIWTPDGRFLTFQSDRDGDHAIFKQPADGSGPAERVTKPEPGVCMNRSRGIADGKTLSINLIRNGDQGVWTIGPEPRGQAQGRGRHGGRLEKHSSFSPDGRWLAYMVNNASGQQRVRSAVSDRPAPSIQISNSGGPGPGLVTRRQTAVLSLAHARTGSSWSISAPQGLTFGNPVALPIEDTIHPIQQRNYDVTADGQRLVVVLPAQAAQGTANRAGSLQVNVVLNWFEELAQRVPMRP